jgi:alkylated DNA nucleotide flippase Atl1
VKLDDAALERVREVVRSIPPGETSTYGEVAERAGMPGRARLVGRILAEDGHDLPWHRVLRANGTCAPHIAQEQSARLRVEGVLLEDGRLIRDPAARSRRRSGPSPAP